MKKQTEQQKIGLFIKELRERKNMTQEVFAKELETSQSAVARMEKGEQNFSTETLGKISEVLNHQIVSINESIDFKITGGRKLSGSINTNFSKNGAVGLLCASLLNKGKTTLHGIARIEEVYRVIEILESIGVSVKWIDNNSVLITPPVKFNLDKINVESAIITRSVIMLIGPLIHLLPSFSIPHASGCKLGKRTISAHTYALEDLGAKIKTTNSEYKIETKKLKPANIIMYEAGDTACENILTAVAKIDGTTTIRFASANYMVQEICFFLENLGVQIDGIGTSTLVVHGVKDIDMDIEYTNSEDPIESMMFISAAIATDSELIINRCPIDFLSLELEKLKRMGLKYKILKKYKSYNDRTNLIDLHVFPSKLKALDDKIHANPYPGINMDNLPFFVPIAIKAKGQTMIHDWLYENRAIYFTELNRLGASITLADPHRVYIQGGTPLKAAQVVCPPALRPAMIILIGMLSASGTSILRNIYMISRGYEEIADRLNAIGADIKILK
ncbi:MAG: UDP-N-acetylglucosamine 1-carboxyvinyltransferase [Candidatus Nomurabacteria bacterium GW2011_GWF2_35_66]|uniref:UDP-N-acetylglucosamine 1-carboxyvinyltransferase n=1 Tax=Candidatus Nomurabacteria bacterium GW2011_GWE1_35_16 TaxID=1618761 RepID=A0A0G0B8E9_9BACT|nr:MAG: UDP-N-acetylglucosamine 1-carboxyvinyltransferase [Candidatus Nomurabacteria bacterium GW2011_GWF1_34_20]KKP63174.1 MAG: UDP-N-acetylglucosamine 1-carboxyvinyltransferase [Candidatus Nomurabacteria bacterium GW2011_GWE2_34_25]KKP65653.1 MAG: UDP-N-acetylglucosamine 1-carboxyvinyltransferase [Candidatus Nomurabacteria bacterium GW2011_GWE1_35_16]KKP83260.1 MAG: UDP-N-acetylglucosamine 1-carboxyvinyltransferase [Candidatus Nomurabacteria bacterium GW2011_GWF2_35_66]HAE36725.1 UDP-N-acetyl